VAATGGNAGAGGGGPCTPGAEEACYEGPAGTEGVGPCTAGTKICARDGMSFGPCEGQILPAPDLCSTTADEDCSGAPTPCVDTTAWSKRFGGVSDDQAARVAVDPQAAVIVAGIFYGTTNLGGTPLTSAGDMDIFLLKLDSMGTHVWSKSFGDTTTDQAYGLATDASGNVILAGGFAASINFGGNTLYGSPGGDLFLAKFAPNGTHVWSKSFGATQAPATRAATDAQGNIYVTGFAQGNVNFGGGLFSLGSMMHVYVAKFDSNGNHVFSKVFGGSTTMYALGQGIGVDALGNVFVAGHYQGSISFGGPTLTSLGQTDIFLAKLDPVGNHVWSNSFGDQAEQQTYDLAADPNGNVVISGPLQGGANFGGGFIGSYARDFFLAKFTGQGNHVFSRAFYDTTNPMDQFGGWSAIDASGRVFGSNTSKGNIDYGGGVKPGGVGNSVSFVALQSSGAHLASNIFDAGGEEYSDAIAADPFGGVILAGHFYTTIDFGQGPLTSAGAADLFVAKLVP